MTKLENKYENFGNAVNRLNEANVAYKKNSDNDIYQDALIKRFEFTFELAWKTLREFMLYDMTTKPEYEANIVAAEILLDTDEVLDYVYNFGYTSEQIAKAMSTDINLVALKVAHLAESNRGLRPIEHRADFLK